MKLWNQFQNSFLQINLIMKEFSIFDKKLSIMRNNFLNQILIGITVSIFIKYIDISSYQFENIQ